MLEEFEKREIEKISINVLKYSKALDVFPTPIDQIVQYADLTVDASTDLSRIDDSFWAKASATVGFGLQLALQKVRGFIDREDKIIYLDLSQSLSRQG